MPRQHPAQCHLGVNTRSELDCIHCDRCVVRQNIAVPERDSRSTKRLNILFLLFVLLAFIGAMALTATSTATWLDNARIQEAPAGVGKPRTVDTVEIKRLIQEGSLSDSEADFYTSK